MFRGMQGWFRLHGFNSTDAAQKSLGAIYGMVQQQAAMLSFVEAFWIMGVIFLGMLPLLFCCAMPVDLHPHTRKAPSAVGQQLSVVSTVEPRRSWWRLGSGD